MIISLALIGGTFWFSKSSAPTLQENSVEQQQQEQAAKEALEQNIPPSQESGVKQTTLSQDLARQLVNEYAQEYLAGDEPAQEEILAKVDEYISDYFIKDYFTEGRIKQTKNADIETKKTYWNKVGAIFANNLTALSDDEFSIFISAIDSNNPAELSKLNGHIMAYSQIVADLQEVQTPEVYAYFHLVSLNAFNNLRTALVYMQSVFEDPVQAILGIKIATEEAQRWQKAMDNAEAEIIQEGIEFNEREPALFIFGNL